MNMLWTADELVEATEGRPHGQLPAGVGGISIDTRSLQPGDAFFAVKGEKMDGHDFATAAVKAGAGVLVEPGGTQLRRWRTEPLRKRHVLADDVRSAGKELRNDQRRLRRHLEL